MNHDHPPVASPPPVDAERARRHRGARISAIVCLFLVLLLAIAAVVLMGMGTFGCWGSVYLFLACLLFLGLPIVVLLLTVAYLRASELIWLGAAMALAYLAVEVITRLLPAVHCSGSG